MRNEKELMLAFNWENWHWQSNHLQGIEDYKNAKGSGIRKW